MGTELDLSKKVELEAKSQHMGVRIMGVGIAIDREQTTAVYDEAGQAIPDKKGKNAIQDFVSRTGVPVYTVAGIREVVDFLYHERVPVMINGSRGPMDEATKEQSEDYLNTCGVN
jgi:orotate phosphoribosyltransferase